MTAKPKEANYVSLKVRPSCILALDHAHERRHRGGEQAQEQSGTTYCDNPAQEFDEVYDFGKVQEILVSKEIPCPFRTGFNYVTVVMWLECENYLVFPYVYKTKIKGRGKNTLKQWVLVNKNLQYAYHVISSFKQL